MAAISVCAASPAPAWVSPGVCRSGVSRDGVCRGAHASEDVNPDVFLQAIADVAKARGMSKLARDTGLGRERLYKALAPGAKPRYDTVIKLVRALGIELHAQLGHAG